MSSRLPAKGVVEACAIGATTLTNANPLWTFGSSSCATNKATPSLLWMLRKIGKGAFRDFWIVDELLNIVPPKEGIVRIRWHSDFINKPFYERGGGHICNHDFRAKGLGVIDERYISSHGRHAGRDSVYDQYSAPMNPGDTTY
ncbi:hypothetical protein K443DRAFT_125690 [Laccaria amethystina LaAM-08-1]|uniref:Uncharacterized protein n=1 Tax=Laccaria amethystina LaAM-08-1 TaxID=1095629 RepID=A0A0C9XA52_9AGAR|nr:hypothetical protein K443DRAFT_125690 [Laccaria amethystina LaAM-08-1]